MTPVDIDDIHDYCQAADLERFFDAVISRNKAIEVKRAFSVTNKGERPMTTTHSEQDILLFAQPYDISATGFYFESLEEYQEKAGKLRNSYGWPVEEFEIQFIDGEAIDACLFKALGVHQGDFDAFLEAAESWDEWQKQKVIIATDECGYDFDLRSGDPDDFDEGEMLKKLMSEEAR